MICHQTRDLIHAYFDGELDLVRSLEIERHLPTCQACALMFQNHQTLRSAFKTSDLYHRAPADLRRLVQASIHQNSRQNNRQNNRAETKFRWPSWQWLSAGASLAAVATVLLLLTPMWTRPGAEDALTTEAVSAHVRSMMADHLVDVPSSDRHTVKPWFNGKLNFSAPVTDLTEYGFPLKGGRLEYLDNRTVAALVYQRQQHIINLFVRPAAQGEKDAAPRTVSQQGFHLIRWTSSGMSFLAVSDLNEKELGEFVRLTINPPAPSAPPARNSVDPPTR
jgi:anti-sigma factor RsiW